MPTPLIVAHRGASDGAPENTAAAFDAALAEAAEGIELDLQLTRDDVVVVYHDHWLGHLGARWARIRDHDWATLAEMDAGRWFVGRATGHRLLRLEQVLERWGSRTHLYLEIKNYDRRAARRQLLAQRVAATVRDYRLSESVSILSFYDSVLDAVRSAAPELALVRNVDRPRGLAAAARRAPGLAAVCVAVDHVSPADIHRVGVAGLPRYAYTCDTPEQLRRAQALGVSAVLSNGPAAARRWYVQHA